jgi:hypothetical protein
MSIFRKQNQKPPIGIDSKGNLLELNYIIDWLFASDQNLTHIDIPDYINVVFCHTNHLKELKLHDGVNTLWCDKEMIDYQSCKIDDVRIYYENPNIINLTPLNTI